MMTFEPLIFPASHTRARVGILGGFFANQESGSFVATKTDLDKNVLWGMLDTI